MEGTLSDLVRDYRLVTRHEGVFTVHFHDDPDAPPSSPCRQERWEKVRTLGRGGQGEVVLQTCIEGGRNFTERAVKRIRLQNGHSKKHYKRELESIVKFSHDRYSKYFVKSLGWYATSNRLYMAMEYFPEGDLYAYICNHEALAEEECSLITSQILSGIALMHEEGFAHRDVKPQNILIYRHPQGLPSSSWWVKIADFGISKKLNTETNLTTLVPGTPLYMAPELLRSEPQSLSINDYRTADVWAVGITTFFMMTKNVPFRSQPAIMNFTGNLDGMIQDNIPARCQISESGRAFIKELLEPQAEKRFDAGSAKLHPWVHHWLPEAPTSGTDSRPSTISSRRSSFEDCRGLTTEISTLASLTTSQRWAGEFHDATMSPQSLDQVRNSSELTSADDQTAITLTRTESRSESTEVQELFHAIDSADYGMVSILVGTGTQVNVPDRAGRTPLYLSATIGHLEITRVLLEGGAIIEATDRFGGHTPLQSAVLNGHTDVAEILLKHGANIEVIDGLEGFTPLGCAVSMNHAAIAKLLLDRGANVEAANESGNTPLMAAARNGSEDLVMLLLEHGANINASNERGHTPIVWAAESGFTEVVKLLIQKGADFSASEGSGLSPLRVAKTLNHFASEQLLLEAGVVTSTVDQAVDVSLITAAKQGLVDQLANLLKQNGACVEEKDACGCTPLILAAREGHVAIVKLLLDNGAKIEASDRAAYTCLMSAAEEGHSSVVSVLLDCGADVKSNDHEGRTSIALAARKGHTRIVRSLLFHNAPVDKANYAGETPLMVAAKYGHKDIVDSLLAYGADIEASDNDGCTSLISAARHGHEQIVRLLLEGNAGIDWKAIGGLSALIEAAKEGHEAVVELLLEEGAAFEATDIQGETALIHAVRGNHEAAVTLLLQIGAYVEAEAKDGSTCLMLAIKNRNKAIMDLLTRHGAKKGWSYYRARFS